MFQALIHFLIHSFLLRSFSFHFGTQSKGATVCYDAMTPWLFRRKLDAAMNPDLEEHVPDYFVKPREAGSYGLFLPRNAFSQNSARSIFSIQSLQCVAQGEWFTVFRYTGGVDPIIIKRANIFPVSFKYLLREKAMLSYLKHRNIAQPITLAALGLKPCKGLVNGGFYPLVCLGNADSYWNDTYFMYEDGGASLKEWFNASTQVSLGDVKSIAMQLLEVLIYLQNKQVVHRDIRMESFVWSNGILKLISLGKSKHMNDQAEENARKHFEREWAKAPEMRAIPGFEPVRCSARDVLLLLLLLKPSNFCRNILRTLCCL